jgi:hypothetical protein
MNFLLDSSEMPICSYTISTKDSVSHGIRERMEVDMPCKVKACGDWSKTVTVSWDNGEFEWYEPGKVPNTGTYYAHPKPGTGQSSGPSGWLQAVEAKLRSYTEALKKAFDASGTVECDKAEKDNPGCVCSEPPEPKNNVFLWKTTKSLSVPPPSAQGQLVFVVTLVFSWVDPPGICRERPHIDIEGF